MTVETMLQICDVSDVVGPRGHKVEVEGIGALAVFQLDGSYFIVDDKCTHGLGSLSQGKVSGAQVICPFHRGGFDFTTGEATVRPCTIALNTYPVRVIGTTICIAAPASVT